MPANKLEPIASNPPIEKWKTFIFPWGENISKLFALNMPELERLYMDDTRFEQLPYDGLRHIKILGGYNAGFTSLELYRLPLLEYAYFSENANLVSVDAHGLVNLNTIDCYESHQLAWLDISGCVSLKYLYLYDCAFSSQMVDQILADLVMHGVENGYINIGGAGNGVPTQAGSDNANILTARGWNVYTSAQD